MTRRIRLPDPDEPIRLIDPPPPLAGADPVFEVIIAAFLAALLLAALAIVTHTTGVAS